MATKPWTFICIVLLEVEANQCQFEKVKFYLNWHETVGLILLLLGFRKSTEKKL